MTDAELDAIEARCRAATEGPWDFDREAGEINGYRGSERWLIGGVWMGTDGEFAAAARTDVPALVAEVRRLREDRDQAVHASQANTRELCRAWEQRDKALAEVARLSEALDAAARVVRRKAEREAGKEEA